jgi:ADP-sugar diphosphatase
MISRSRIFKRLLTSPHVQFLPYNPSASLPRRTMTTSFQLPDNDAVTVSLPDSDVILKDDLLDFKPFQSWLEALQKNLALQKNSSHPFHACPYELKKIEVQSVDWFGESLGFVKFSAEIENEDFESLPGSVFMRGPSVAMMVVLQPDDVPPASQEEKHVILTVQPRIAAGSLAFTELPAGMVDGSGNFNGAAAREIKEELGIEIGEGKLKNLTELAIPSATTDEDEALPQALFPSPGGSDEHISIFLHERRVPRSQLAEWTGKLTGLRDEGEKITLKLVPLKDLWREGGRDGKTVAAYGFYVGLKAEGKI